MNDFYQSQRSHSPSRSGPVGCGSTLGAANFHFFWDGTDSRLRTKFVRVSMARNECGSGGETDGQTAAPVVMTPPALVIY